MRQVAIELDKKNRAGYVDSIARLTETSVAFENQLIVDLVDVNASQ